MRVLEFRLAIRGETEHEDPSDMAGEIEQHVVDLCEELEWVDAEDRVMGDVVVEWIEDED